LLEAGRPEPDLFAAVVPICGGGDPASAGRLVNLPVWAVPGDADRATSVELARAMIAAIRDAGGQPVDTELKGVGHNSWTETYRDPVEHDFIVLESRRNMARWKRAPRFSTGC
jgi:predicted peptidase